MKTVSPLPAATSNSAQATTRRMPNRSISAAANGAVRPKSSRLTETAAEIVAQRPAELGVQRVDQHARGRAEAGRADQGDEGHGGDDPGGVNDGGSGHARPVCGADRVKKRVAREPSCVIIGPSHRVAVLALDRVVALDLGTPPQVFGAARRRRRHPALRRRGLHTRRRPGRRTGRVPGPARARRRAHRDRRHVVVPGIPTGRRCATASCRRRRGTRCTPRTREEPGSCPSVRVPSRWPPPACSTAAARPRTGRYADRFRRLYPRVDLDPDVLFVDDGDMLTSAGVAAGIDLCLHIVRRDHGARSPTAPPAGASCRPGATAARRSSSSGRSPTAPAPARRPPANGSLGRLEEPLTCARWPITPA